MIPSARTVLVLVMLAHVKVGSRSVHNGEVMMRVIKGENASSYDYPFVVALAIKRNFCGLGYIRHCTGSLITNKWTLTAAHCFHYYKKESLRILYGSLTFLPDDTKSFKQVKEVVVHSDYKNYVGIKKYPVAKNDIALVKSDAVNIKTFGRISGVDYLSLIGRSVKYVGTGSTNVNVIKFKKVSKALCKLYEQDNMRTRQEGMAMVSKCPPDLNVPFICLVPKCEVPTQVAYYGDSGGPVLYRGKIVGVLNSGLVKDGLVKDANDYVMLFYTPIGNYLSYIQNTTSS